MVFGFGVWGLSRDRAGADLTYIVNVMSLSLCRLTGGRVCMLGNYVICSAEVLGSILAGASTFVVLHETCIVLNLT